MRGYFFTVSCGIFVWFMATMFFVLFGERVLFEPGTDLFVVSTILLIAGTAILLWICTLVYRRFDVSENAAIKFGIVGTMIGLLLDTFSLANHHYVFPALNESQIIAFTAWMSCAYALYLLIPAMMNGKRDKLDNL